MNYKKLLPMLVFLALGLSCSKEKQLPSSPELIEVKYKIEPNKLGEFRELHIARKNGTQLRVENEPLTEETFFLYAEALLNSMLVDQSLEATSTQERIISMPFTGEAFSLNSLLEYIAEAEIAIQNDITGVVFDHDPQATKFVSIIDVDWSNGGEIYYIVAINPEMTQNPFIFNMTLTSNANCSNLALTGHFQNRVIWNWNNLAGYEYSYQPDMLFHPIYGTNRPGPNEPIPNSTYTDIQRVTVDYEVPSDRHYYNEVRGLELWQRSVPNAAQPAPCMPDTKNGDVRTLNIHSLGTSMIGANRNPNQWHQYGNPNGLAIMGISVEAKAELSENLAIVAPQGQYEHWHKVTYVYGRQIIYTGVPISNE